eukprot:591123-Pyramimonas_sp.AAC.1
MMGSQSHGGYMPPPPMAHVRPPARTPARPHFSHSLLFMYSCTIRSPRMCLERTRAGRDVRGELRRRRSSRCGCVAEAQQVAVREYSVHERAQRACPYSHPPDIVTMSI